MSCLYILEINPLSVASFANILSHSEGCLFILSMVSFAVQKLLSLIRSHLFVFIFITLGGGSKKILLWFMSKSVLPMFSSKSLIVSSVTFRLSYTLDESLPWKTIKILNIQLQQLKAPKWNQTPPSFCYYCKELRHWEIDCYKFKHFRHLQPSNCLSDVLSILNDKVLRKYKGSFPVLPLNWLGETFPQIGAESLPVLIHTRTLSTQPYDCEAAATSQY